MKTKGTSSVTLKGKRRKAKPAKTETIPAYEVRVTTSFKRRWLKKPFEGFVSDGGSKHRCMVIASSPMDARSKAEKWCLGIIGALSGGCCEMIDVRARSDCPVIIRGGVLTTETEYVM